MFKKCDNKSQQFQMSFLECLNFDGISLHYAYDGLIDKIVSIGLDNGLWLNMKQADAIIITSVLVHLVGSRAMWQ